METTINLHILEKYVCLEPKAGEKLLPLYPEFLEQDQKAAFELHLQGCEACQERWKLWRATGLALRIERMLEQANALLRQRQYAEAIARYNQALEIAPDAFETAAARNFFLNEAWTPLTSARSKTRDISLFAAPSYDPGKQALAAASLVSAFPITLEYADGNVILKIFALGRFIFAELLAASQEFEAGLQLVGKEACLDTSLSIWTILPEKKQKLGTLETLFGSTDFADIICTVRTFRVFPLCSE